MGRFKENFVGTHIFYHDDDWKFEDEEENLTSQSPSKQIAPVDGTLPQDEEARTILPTVDRQLSMATTTLERKMFQKGISKTHPTAWDHQTCIGKLRFQVHHVIDHVVTRIFTLLLVIFDIAIVLTSLFDKENEKIYAVINLVVVSYFLIEVALRMFAWGSEFFHHRLEVIDLVVIIITFVVTVVVESLQYQGKIKQVKYAHLIVVFRIFRVGLYLKVFYGVWQSVRRAMRNLVGQNKRRYVMDGFNLDLTYINDRLIAMSFPSSGLIASYRNPIEEVAKFFNEKHTDHYMIWNLCSERHYDTSHFHDRVERLMIDDHNVPKLTELVKFCEDADKWMKLDKNNVLAIHCKGGKGRTGTCIAGHLLYSGQISNANKALLYFGKRRTDQAEGVTFQGVETPSQIRYVQYLERVLKEFGGKVPEEKVLMLESLRLSGLQDIGNGDGSDLIMQIIMNGNVVFETPVLGTYSSNKDVLVNKFAYDKDRKLQGDVKFRFVSSNDDVPEDYDDCAFFFWLHTSFVINYKFYATRENIGNSHKPKYHDIYTDSFSVTLKFAEPAHMANVASSGVTVARAAKAWRFKSQNKNDKSLTV